MLKNILLSNIDVSKKDINYRRIVMINIGYIVAMISFLLFSASNFFIRKYTIIAGIEFIFALLLFYSFMNLRIEKDIDKNTLQANYLFFFLLLATFFMFDFKEGVIFWAFLFPFVTTTLVGGKIGFKFIVVFNLIVYAGTYYYWRIDSLDVKLIEYIRFVVVSVVMAMLVYFYEKSFSEFLVVQRELNESLNKSMKEIKMLAITDSLTNLYNKRHFDTILSEEFNQARLDNDPFTLAIIDVDNFKLYNDTYGHDSGNDVLEQMGVILKTNTLYSSEFVFRIGGEEFALILRSVSKDEVCAYFENLRKEVFKEKIQHVKNTPYGFLTVSIGIVSVLNFEKTSIIDAYQIADKNLYAVKDSGRNAILFSEA